MVTHLHKTLAEGKWETFSLPEQMAHIGSEVSRAGIFHKKQDNEKTFNSLARGLDLIDLTITHAKKTKRFSAVRELFRMREVLCDYFAGDNEYNSDIKSLQQYFDDFAIAVALKKGR